MSAARIVGYTTLDLNTLLPLTEKLTGHNIGAFADSKRLTPPMHHLQCLASFDKIQTNNLAGNVKHLHNMFEVLVLVACDSRDTAELLSILSMRSLLAETVNRDFECFIVCGTLAEWDTAFRWSANPHVTPTVRDVLMTIYYQFCDHGMKGLFNLTPVTKQNIMYLEHKP